MEGTTFQIVCGNRIPRRVWADFVKCHPKGNVFQTPWMYDLYQNTSHNSAIAISVLEKQNGKLIIRGLLLAHVVFNGFALLRSLTERSIVIGGPLVDEDVDKVKVWDLLLSAYKKELPRSVIYTEIRPVFEMSLEEEFFVQAGFIRQGHYNLMMDIRPEIDQLWSKMHKERRRNVTYASKVGLEFRAIEDENEIIQAVGLIRQTYLRKRVPLSDKELLFRADKQLGNIVQWFAVFFGEKMIACQVRLCYKNLVYAWYAASNDAFFKLRPNDFLTWNVLCWAHEHGYESYDFGGGGEPGKPYGVRDYKLKYGCEIYDFGRFVYTHRPLMYRFGKASIQLLKLKKT